MVIYVKFWIMIGFEHMLRRRVPLTLAIRTSRRYIEYDVISVRMELMKLAPLSRT